MKHLTVFFDDALVGRLAEAEGGGLYFTYTHDWLVYEFATWMVMQKTYLS